MTSQRTIAQAVIRKYFRETRIELVPLPGADRLPALSPVRKRIDHAEIEPMLTSPFARIHTSHSKTRHKSPTLGSRELLPSSHALHRTFVKIPTMLGRRSKKIKTGTGLEYKRLDPIELPSGGRGYMLVATNPRTTLEKLLHRRAIWLQRWWKRMHAQLLYCRATRLNSYFRVLLAKQTTAKLRERRSRCRKLLAKVQCRTTKSVLTAWRRIFNARVLGIRMRMIYRCSLITHVWSHWHTAYKSAKAKEERTVFYFRRWMRHRSLYRSFTELRRSVQLCRQIKSYFVMKHFRAFSKYVQSMQDARSQLLNTGRAKIENRCANQIQRVWLAYASALASMAASDSLSLDVIHNRATEIQKMFRGRLGRRTALHRAIAFSAVCTTFSKAWRKIKHLESRALERSKMMLEAARAKREREAIALADFNALKTQQEWENSQEGQRDLNEAKMLIAVSPACKMLSKHKQLKFATSEARAHTRRNRRAKIAQEALERFRLHDPPAFECRACYSPFSSKSEAYGHVCTSATVMKSKFMLRNDTTEFKARLLEENELQTETVHHLFDAFFYVEKLLDL